MVLSALAATTALSQHMPVQSSKPAAASTLPTQTQSGTKIDRDGDYDNSTPASDAAEGKGTNVNLYA
ncbi:MAG TPA: hypothetical protein VMV93_01960 [Chloroflexota bacterium]|nr:hypothetical protein [Chloroflexota bacterium]